MGQVYGFAKGPVYHGDEQAMFQSLFDRPASWIGTAEDVTFGAAEQSVGLGTIGRRLATPPADAPTEPGLIVGEMGTAVPDTPAMRRRLTAFGDLAIVRPETQAEFQRRRQEAKALDQDTWKSSPFFRDDIPWDPGMTEDRAAALAIAYDRRKVREHFASKRPFTSLIFGFVGQAFDPINYIPIAGPAVKAAQVARLGRVAGGAATAALDAAANTALFGVATAGERARYGDDVSWQAQITDIAVGALIGSAFGAIGGGIEAWRAPKQAPGQDIVNRLADLKRVQESRIALNEGSVAMANGEDIALSPNATEPMRRAAVDVQAARPARPDLSTDPRTIREKTTAVMIGGRLFTGERHADGIEKAVQTFGADSPEIRAFEALDDPMVAMGIYDPKKSPAGQPPGFRSGISGDLGITATTALQVAKNQERLEAFEARRGVPAMSEPPVPAGHVRVYHSGSIGEGETGRWVSTNRQYASDYRGDLPLHYLDIPENDPRVNNADIPEQGVKQGFTFNFETTPEEAARLKVIARLPGGAGRAASQPAGPASTIDTSAPRPDPIPEGRPEAEAAIGKPESMQELAAAHGVDLATGEFDEMADIDQLRTLGRLTDEDEADLAAASENFEAAEAYGNALKAALACVI